MVDLGGYLWIWEDILDMRGYDGYGRILMDMGEYGWTWEEICGYGRLFVYMQAYGRILVDMGGN